MSEENVTPNLVARYVWSDERAYHPPASYHRHVSEYLDEDDDHYVYNKICTDRLTGGVVVRYDTSDPANYAKSHGGLDYREWLERKGLNPDEEITLEQCKTPVTQHDANVHEKIKKLRAQREKEESEALELFSILPDEIEIAFDSYFNSQRYREGENKIIIPAMEALGFTNVRFTMAEEDSPALFFGPLARWCIAINAQGKQVRFYYG